MQTIRRAGEPRPRWAQVKWVLGILTVPSWDKRRLKDARAHTDWSLQQRPKPLTILSSSQLCSHTEPTLGWWASPALLHISLCRRFHASAKSYSLNLSTSLVPLLCTHQPSWPPSKLRTDPSALHTASSGAALWQTREEVGSSLILQPGRRWGQVKPQSRCVGSEVLGGKV